MKRISILLSVIMFSGFAFSFQEMPSEISIKLDEKSKQLFPDDISKQNDWLRKQKLGWESLQVPLPIEGNDDYVKKLNSIADKKFELDFAGKFDFIQKGYEALMVIDSFGNTGIDIEEFKAIKKKSLEKNPEDYSAAAKFVENQVTARMEFNNIPCPYGIEDSMFLVIKEMAKKSNPDDVKKQLEELNKNVLKFSELAIAQKNEEERKRQESELRGGEKQISSYEKQEAMKAELRKSIFIVQTNPSSSGLFTNIERKNVILIPSTSYNPRGITISNANDDRVGIGEVFASKDAPIVLIVPQNIPVGMIPAKMASEPTLKEQVGKDNYILSFSGSNSYLARNKILSLSGEYVVLENRIPSSIVEGSPLLDKENNDVLGMIIYEREFAKVSNLANTDDVAYLIRSFSREKMLGKAIRLDKLRAWERIDVQMYSKQKQILDAFSNSNKEYLEFFRGGRFGRFESASVLSNIYTKYAPIFKQRMNKTMFSKNLKAMIQDLVLELKTGLKNVGNETFYSSLRSEFNFNYDLRKEMIATLEQALKTQSESQFTFEDFMKPSI